MRSFASEMTEWEFLSEVVELADCGILLDVNNIYVSSQNHNFDPDYLNNIPSSRGSDSYRRPFEVREVNSRYTRHLCSTPCGVCARTQ